MTWLTSVFPAKHNLLVLVCDILYSTTPYSCLQLLPNNYVIISLPYTFDSEWSFVYSQTITMRCYLSSTNQGMISLTITKHVYAQRLSVSIYKAEVRSFVFRFKQRSSCLYFLERQT